MWLVGLGLQSGNAKELGETCGYIGKSCLFLLTERQSMEWVWLEICFPNWKSSASFALSDQLPSVLENPSEWLMFTRRRTDIRNRSPRWVASGRWGKASKGSRQNRFVTLEKELALGAELSELGRKAGNALLLDWDAASAVTWAGGEAVCGAVLLCRLRAASGSNKRWTQNCHGLGDSDCIIKTKHCDGVSTCWRNVISAQCSECQGEEICLSAGKRRE